MRKQVYLFELDSVRKTDAEIETGQRALYDEIVVNGNTVVLTYNQLVDSRAFFSLLDEKEYYDSLIKLCEEGRIRISQYGDIRTISQYLLNSTEDDKQFIYSALPLKHCQKRLTALLRRSLVYSDLSEIHDYFTGHNRSQDEIRDLFIEVHDGELKQSALNDSQMQEILRNLYWLLSTVLRLSAIHDMYIPPKDPSEYANLKLHNILDAALRLEHDNDPLWISAKVIIKHLSCLESDNRSVFLREIKNASQGQTVLSPYQYAEAIVNLCYNYACEISICNVSKHYNIDEFSQQCSDMATFSADFFSRLAQDWRDGVDAELRYLVNETNLFEQYKGIGAANTLGQAVRLTDYDNVVSDDNAVSTERIQRYEYELTEQQKKRRSEIICSIAKKFGIFCICVLVACIVELISQGIQDVINGESITGIFSDLPGLCHNIVLTIILLFLTELVTSWMTKLIPGMVSLGDALSGVGNLFLDGRKVLGSKSSAYVNPCAQSLEQTEKSNIGVHIDCVTSSDLKNYIKYCNERRDCQDSRFFDSEMLPFAKITEPAVLRKLNRLEELFHYKFGVVYKSGYNAMIVDPIEGGKYEFYPYERIIPSSDTDGTVMVTVHKGHYILLKQYRHALRKEQFAFPRGYAEPGEMPEDSVIRELKEELNAVVTKSPVFLGRITPDSGLSGTDAYVYKVEIDEYQTAVGHEGILDYIEIPIEEFADWIHSGNTDDGFTLGAYALLSNH